MNELKKLVEEICLVASRTALFIKKECLSFDPGKLETKGLNDLVSYVDKQAERMIVDALLPLIPDAGFITEENTFHKHSNDYNWIIDPLDGTTNFIHGLPVFAISIALMKNQKLVLGVVYEVNKHECFYAWDGGGAWLNGSRIHCSSVKGISESLVATGFPYSDFEKMDQYLSILKELMKSTHGLRRMGSAAVDLAYMACGRFDAFFEYNLKPWDVAAGALIVQEAGGIVTDFKGKDNYVFGKEIIASTPSCISALQKIIVSHFSSDNR